MADAPSESHAGQSSTVCIYFGGLNTSCEELSPQNSYDKGISKPVSLCVHVAKYMNVRHCCQMAQLVVEEIEFEQGWNFPSPTTMLLHSVK